MTPLVIRNKVMPRRIAFSRAIPVFITGTNDVHIMDQVANFIQDTARNGAAMLAFPAGKFPCSFERSAEFAQIHHSAADPEGEEDESGFRPPEPGELKGVDMTMDENRIKYARAVEAAHDEGALACISMMDIEPFGWTCDELSTDQMEYMIDLFVEAAKSYYSLGFDAMCFYMSAGMSILGMSMSPAFNHRTDRFGGSNMRERATLSFEIFRRVRKACPDVIIEAQFMYQDVVPEGFTFDDVKEYLKLADEEGLIDVVQLRTPHGGTTYLDSDDGEPPALKYAAELKALGTNVKIAPVSGFSDPRLIDQYLAEGKCDFVYMARQFLCDSEYGVKLKEGRPDDITPCLRCNKCHSRPGDPDGGCAVNPRLYIAASNRENWEIKPAEKVKKVAVIGGGPAGMEAAQILSRRGHQVTLYEASGVLGGQLIHSDYFQFKWSLKKFKDYMIAQTQKCGCKIEMNTKATPELLDAGGYDAIVVATGAACAKLDIPGADGANVYLPDQTLGQESKLGKKCVIIGGSETGTEYGLHLARECGIEVVVTTRRNRLAGDAQLIHYREFLMQKCWDEPNFHYITKVTPVEILPDGKGVRLVDRDGKEQVVQADSVITSAGVKSRTEDFAGYAAVCDEVYYVGDCKSAKDVRRALKNAYNAAVRI
jgi:2,4-dienoyl-CoA reductase-like NADH-dependent reductase (Old Yellow Enzyme family)/thioredoxin reductase